MSLDQSEMVFKTIDDFVDHFVDVPAKRRPIKRVSIMRETSFRKGIGNRFGRSRRERRERGRERVA